MTLNSNLQRAQTRPPARAASRAADRFVLMAQALVILAFAVGLSAQAGLHPAIAASAAAAVVVALFAINKVLAPRSRAAGRYRNDTPAPAVTGASRAGLNRGEAAVADLAPAPVKGAPDEMPEWPAELDYAGVELARLDVSRFDTDFAVSPLTQGGATVKPPLFHSNVDTSALVAAVNASAPAVAPSPPSIMPPPMPRYTEPSPGRAPPPLPMQNHYAPQHSPELPVYAAAAGTSQDYWGHRPSQPRFDERGPQTHHSIAATLNVPPTPSAAVGSDGASQAAITAGLRETDVEAIQSLIKKLADEVNSAEHYRPESAAAAIEQATAPMPITAAHFEISAAPAEPDVLVAPVPSFEPERALEHSLDALRATAQTMRQPSHQFFGHELPPPIPPLPSRAQILAEAIAAGRTEVLLEPILGLQSQEAQHFEVSVRLRADDGAALEFNARDVELRGTGLLPLFDAAKIARTASVARRLTERGKTGAVFSSYSGEALNDSTFRDDAAAAARQRTPASGPLVLTFAQSDARGFEAPEWNAIAQMRELGFRFALSDVTDLDMDLEGLVGAGFDFVKLDAEVFLNGLQSPSGLIASADVCGFLGGLGLALVVEHIDDEDKFARVSELGVLLGQGQLFGGARVLKAEASNTSGQAAA